MLIDGLINSILLCRVLSQLIINSEPLTKSNNSPINLTPAKKNLKKLAPLPPPAQSCLLLDPPSTWNSVALRGEGMDIFWNYTISPCSLIPSSHLRNQIFGLLFPRVGHSLVWAIRVCAAEQGMLFKVLSLKQGIQFHY